MILAEASLVEHFRCWFLRIALGEIYCCAVVILLFALFIELNIATRNWSCVISLTA
jgi:hypothetical protein